MTLDSITPRRLSKPHLAEAAGLWAAEQRETYPHATPVRPADIRPLFEDVVLPASESVWAIGERRRLFALLALKTGHIAHLYVLPEWRGRGYGSSLIVHSKRIYTGGLTVHTAAHVASYYYRHGFVTVREYRHEGEVELRWLPQWATDAAVRFGQTWRQPL